MVISDDSPDTSSAAMPIVMFAASFYIAVAPMLNEEKVINAAKITVRILLIIFVIWVRPFKNIFLLYQCIDSSLIHIL